MAVELAVDLVCVITYCKSIISSIVPNYLDYCNTHV